MMGPITGPPWYFRCYASVTRHLPTTCTPPVLGTFFIRRTTGTRYSQCGLLKIPYACLAQKPQFTASQIDGSTVRS